MTAVEFLNIFYAIVLSMVAGVPLVGALGCCLPTSRKTRLSLLPWTTVPALLTGLLIPGTIEVQVPWFFMGGVMGIDQVGRIFLFLSAFIWLLAASRVTVEFRDQQGERRFSGYFLVAMAGNFGLILARDMLGFYLFFAIMSFAAYGLINHDRTPESRRAGRIYLILVMVSELAMFTALALISSRAQSQSLSDIAGISLSLPALILLFIAFGVKVGALPLQVWMPRAYQQSPIPGAVALAGAMVNAGLLGWLRFIPLGHFTSEAGALLFITAGALASLYGVIYGLAQLRLGAVLASSSISQMGLMTIIVGLGLCSPEAGEYAVYLLPLYAVHHSLAKGSLFLGYDAVARYSRVYRPLLLLAILLPSLSLSGLPLTSGAVVKTGLKELVHISGYHWYTMGKIFLPVSSIGTTVLMLHGSRLLWRENRKESGRRAVKLWPWFAALAGAAFWLWLWPAAAKPGSHSLEPSFLFSSFWPVAAGSVLALIWFKLLARVRGKDSDLLPKAGLGEKVAGYWPVLQRRIRAEAENFSPSPVMAWAGQWLSLAPASPLGRRLRKPEKVLGRWSLVGFFYLSVCILLLFLFIYG